MRLAAASIMLLVVGALAGCTAAPTPAPSPSATPTATLTVDGAFDRPLICREIADYDPVQNAIGAGDLVAMHRTAKASDADFVDIIAAEKAHTWAAAAAAAWPDELRWAEEAEHYYRAVGGARTVDDAVNLVWPDGTVPNTAFWNAIGVPLDISCV